MLRSMIATASVNLLISSNVLFTFVVGLNAHEIPILDGPIGEEQMSERVTVSDDELSGNGFVSLTSSRKRTEYTVSPEAFHYGTTSEGISYYYITTGLGTPTVYINGYNGDAGTLVIPAVIEGMDVKEIREGAFRNNHTIENIVIPGSIYEINSEAFQNCDSLQSVDIQEGVRMLWHRVFENCANLREITLPDSLEGIGAYCFRSCNSLEEISLPDRIKYINSGLFSECRSLRSIQLPSGLLQIYDNAFQRCDNLASISFPVTLIEIGNNVFPNCTSLQVIDFPESFTKIGYANFWGCDGLRSVYLPASLTNIGHNNFVDCTSLETIEVADANPSYSDVGGVLFNKAKTVLLDYPAGRADDYHIPYGVQTIERFNRVDLLTEVTIPSTVTEISSDAFRYCSALEIVNFLGNAPALGTSVFSDVADGFTVYYRFGATGFTSPIWEGYASVGRPLSNDMNNDGYGDLLLSDIRGLSLKSYHLDGSGVASSSYSFSFSDRRQLLASADVNGDGWNDLITQSVLDPTLYRITFISEDGAISESAEVEYHVSNPLQLVGVGDLNSDRNPDLLWQHLSSGQLIAWFLDDNGDRIGSSVWLDSISNWRIVAIADMDKDGHLDLLWQSIKDGTSGEVAVWNLDGNGLGERTGASVIAKIQGLGWQVVGAGDYDEDGNADLILQHQDDKKIEIWYLNSDNQHVSTGSISHDEGYLVGHWSWEILGEADRSDWDGDGNADMMWQSLSTDGIANWLMNGAGVREQVNVLTDGVDNDELVGTADMNRDGYLDLLLFQRQDFRTGYVEVWYGNGSGSFVGTKIYDSFTAPLTWNLIGSGDMNEDGAPDLVWQHGPSGQVAVWYLNLDGERTGASVLIDSVTSWQVVTVVDMNADGHEDILWQRIKNRKSREVAVWYMDGSGQRIGASVIADFAGTNWRVVDVADYNEDGYLDLLWQHQGTGQSAAWLLNEELQRIGILVLSDKSASWRVAHWSWK